MEQNAEYFEEGRIFSGSVPFVMGTKLEALVIGTDKSLASDLWAAICAEAERLNAMLNRYDPDSELSRINQMSGLPGVTPTEEFASMLRMCEKFKRDTCGLFDISRGTSPGDYLNSDGTMSCRFGSLDMGGFAKGYFLRKCRQMLTDAGVRCAYIDFGGSSIMTIGHHPYGECWRIEVKDPFTRFHLGEVDLLDSSMSTSGNQPGYEGHIINPLTGQRVMSRRVAVVVSPDPLLAEVTSTAVMMADEKSLDIIKNNTEISEIFVYN